MRCGGRHSGIDNRWNWDAYRVKGKVRILSPKEGKRMMGFPDTFKFPVAERFAMRQLGNAVAVPAIKAIGAAMLDFMRENQPKKATKRRRKTKARTEKETRK